MADEATQDTQAVEQETAVETPQSETPTPDATGTPSEARFTQADLDRIVKDRLAQAKTQAEKATQKAREEAERKAAEEQGKWKELYEKTLAEAEAERKRAQELELSQLRRSVADKVGIPAALASRLQGEDEAALEQDAKALLASLPRPVPPNVNALAGNGAAPNAHPLAGLSDEEIARKAAKLNVSPVYLKQSITGG